VEWIELVQDMAKWRVAQNASKFLSSWPMFIQRLHVLRPLSNEVFAGHPVYRTIILPVVCMGVKLGR